jgi:NADH:ubiquinone oxidoreductase subunit 4 (subunit M)
MTMNPTIIDNITHKLHTIVSSSGGSGSNPHVCALVIFILTATIFISIIPKEETRGLRIFSLFCSLFYIALCCHMVYFFDVPRTIVTPSGFHFPYNIPLIPEYNINLSFGIDGISLCFLLLTGFIMTLCLFALSPREENFKTYLIYLYFVYIFLTISFCVTNLLFFFVFFESVLIPMFIIIGIWGTRARKIKAAYYFFFFTLLGSFFLLYGMYQVYSITGSLEYEVLLNFSFTHQQQIYL